MPVTIQDTLPAAETLAQENIFFMTKERAVRQDIRPLQIALLNLMPNKSTTETQFLRLLGNTALQVEVTFLCTGTYTPKHTDTSYLETFYKTFEQVKDQQFDGLIVTGAPIETLEFEEVTYWNELVEILNWAQENVYSSLFVCWGAQAALHHYYKIGKQKLEKKLSGVYSHTLLDPHHTLVRGFDDEFDAPHSRHTTVDLEAVKAIEELIVLGESPEAGLYLASSKDDRKVFITGHCEYDLYTLDAEYQRDREAGMCPSLPYRYYPNDDSTKKPSSTWRSHAHLLFNNWLNYSVYQETPYCIGELTASREAGPWKDHRETGRQ